MSELKLRITQYGKQIDELMDSAEIDKLEEFLTELEKFIGETGNDYPEIYYYLGTGYGVYSSLLIRNGRAKTDHEVMSSRNKAFRFFRRALDSIDKSVLNDPRLFYRILTNYANCLDSAGRVIEALRFYRMILDINPKFSIARGNYGRALQYLANMVNDGGHHNELHCYAYQAYKTAVAAEDPEIYEDAKESFRESADDYEKSHVADIIKKPIKNKKYSLGNKEESKYRRWCLENHLFLNPLNELQELESAFAHDPLTITTIVELERDNRTNSAPPRWFAMLNQLKEEYVYARYLCYSSLESPDKIHMADKEVTLSHGSFDYASYSIRIEQMKSAFRLLYSMLDQICFFANDFWHIGLRERNADAKHLVKKENYPYDNVAMTSLYWVLSEFYDVFGNDEDPPEKNMCTLRNAIEHKFVKVLSFGEDDKTLSIKDDQFYHITEEQLKNNTLRLLRLVRESLMYLVYAVGINESQKGKLDKCISLNIQDYPDELKR